jgi:diguanylate cyclase (GGDEF)-like protein
MPDLIRADDLPVIALVTLALLGINVLVGVWVSVVHPREEGPATWALANVLFATGVSVLMLRVPQQEPYVALFGNVILVTSYLLMWFGFLRFRVRTVPYYPAGIGLLAYVAAFAWFLLAQPDIVVRVSLTASTIALLCGLITGTMLYRIEAGLVQTQAFIGMLFGALGMLNLLRAVAAATGALQPSDFGGGPLGAGIFVLPTIASMLATATCILMLNQRLQQRLQVSAQTDPLTGLINRGLLDDLGRKEVARAKRHAYGLSIVVMELDHFDAINSAHGYETGDTVLRRLSMLATASLRQEDYIARLDESSFALLLPSTRMAGAQQMAERLRLEIAATTLETGGEPVTLTASFGIAAFGLHGDDWNEMVQRAQMALYRAKTDGGNRIELAALSDAMLERSA